MPSLMDKHVDSAPGNDHPATADLRSWCLLIDSIVAIGGLALLLIGLFAALDGVYQAAAFIGACGLILLGTVAWARWQHRPAPPSGG